MSSQTGNRPGKRRRSDPAAILIGHARCLQNQTIGIVSHRLRKSLMHWQRGLKNRSFPLGLPRITPIGPRQNGTPESGGICKCAARTPPSKNVTSLVAGRKDQTRAKFTVVPGTGQGPGSGHPFSATNRRAQKWPVRAWEGHAAGSVPWVAVELPLARPWGCSFLVAGRSRYRPPVLAPCRKRGLPLA